MPLEKTSKGVRVRVRSPKTCAPGSFRTVPRGKVRVIVCCPRGKWKNSKCSVSMKAQSILKLK